MFHFSLHALPHILECSKSCGFGTVHHGTAQLAALLNGVKPFLKYPQKVTENPSQSKSSEEILF